MASNEYLDMTELIKDYYDMPVGTYLNQSISINSVTLPCDIYRVESDTVLTSAVFTGCTAVDANTQIVVGKDMSVVSGTTLIPPYRCKGIVIGDVGTFTNSGTISMTARGASGAGKNIKLVNNYQISATGGSGATSRGGSVTYNCEGFNGNDGSAPSSGILSCGGGGGGGCNTNGGKTIYGGAGGSGTSFSGGAGGGGCSGGDGGTGNAGSSIGGAGGAAKNTGNTGGTTTAIRGGAGNPAGSDVGSENFDSESGIGTGGLIVILASKIISSGSLTSVGTKGKGLNSNSSRQFQSGGGSSGGGCIVLISRERSITGTNSVAGGGTPNGSGTYCFRGGAGGSGVYASYIVEDLILVNLPIEFAITDKDHVDNIDPSEAVRFMGLTDEDELVYDIMGKRHRASNGKHISDGTTTLTQRDTLEVASPLTVEDDSTNEVTKLGADTSGSLDFTQIQAPGTAGQVEGHIYSTDETVVGKWIDGRNVYEKTIVYTKNDFSSGSTEKVHGISNVELIWFNSQSSFLEWTTSNGKHTWVIGSWNGTTGFAFSLFSTWARADKFNLYIGSNIYSNMQSTDKVYITFNYIKTTDTV